MRPDASRWFEHRTYRAVDAPPVAEMVTRKAGLSVSVVLPARDEQATIGDVLGAVVPLQRAGLVDEVIVLDAASTDDTAEIATVAGATVLALDDVLPGHGSRGGKGEALWKGLHVTDGDLVVYLDTDLVGVTPGWVVGLLWPLLVEPAVSFVKACYDRPLALPGAPVTAGGGRVTELVARPLLDLLWPALAGVIQPLAGEYAARRSLLERLPYAGGYAVELGLLVDALGTVGLDGLAQVDLGVRRHRHQPTDALGRMAAGILAAALSRAGMEPLAASLTQFDRVDGELTPVESVVGAPGRPPMITVPEYAARRAQAS